jgi:enoyl-CoA hydratase
MAAPIAHRWGLVNRLTAPGGALQGALQLAQQITTNAPLAVAMSKRIVRESSGWRDEEIWAKQRPLAESVLASDDAQEGARAFAEKRAPNWRGQ